MRQWRNLGRFGLSAVDAWGLEDEHERHVYLDPLGTHYTAKVFWRREPVLMSPPLPLEQAKAWGEEALAMLEEGLAPRLVEARMRERERL